MSRASEYVLGRRPTRERLARDGKVSVSAVQCLKGTPEAWVMFVETTKVGRANPPVLYRIHVRLK